MLAIMWETDMEKVHDIERLTAAVDDDDDNED